MPESSSAAIRLSDLTWGYEDSPPLFRNLNLSLPKASRCLLIGANGVGKSTLLRLIAGHHLLAREQLHVFGSSPFYETALASRVALVDGDFPIHVDLRVRELLAHPVSDIDSSREAELIEILEIDPEWRMCRVSEGQRRRVQLLLALRRNVDLLLLDEVTAHLDVVARFDFMLWLRRESERRGLTVFYATHILDGLWADARNPWATHLAFMSFTQPLFFAPVAEIPELAAAGASPLLRLCEDWIRRDVERRG